MISPSKRSLLILAATVTAALALAWALGAGLAAPGKKTENAVLTDAAMWHCQAAVRYFAQGGDAAIIPPVANTSVDDRAYIFEWNQTRASGLRLPDSAGTVSDASAKCTISKATLNIEFLKINAVTVLPGQS